MSTRDDLVSLTHRLKSLRNYMTFCRLAYGLVLAMTAFAVILIAANVFNALAHLPVWFRVAYLLISGIVLLIGLYVYIFRPLAYRPSLEAVSLQVEGKYPRLENRLIASLQLERNLRENRENYSVEMIRALISQTSGVVEGLNLRESFSNNPLKRLAKYSGSLVAVVVAMAVLAPGLFSSSLHVFSHPLREIEVPGTFEIAVEPGSAEVLKYDPFEITVVARGEKLPRSARLFWDNSDGGGQWRSEELEPVVRPAVSAHLSNALGVLSDSTAFAYTFREVKHGFRYFVRAGQEESPEFVVEVVDKPRITDLKLTYFYPKYTGLKPVVIDENDGNIQALKGTKIEVELTTSKPIEGGSLVFSDGSAVELMCDETGSKASFTVMGSRSYHAEVTDFSGFSNPHPIEYRVTMLEDAYPEIFMISPGGNLNLDDNMAVDLAAGLSDDFGFAKLLLHYTMHLTVAEQWDRTEEIAIDKGRPEQQVSFFWDLANVGMLPGSWIEYYLEVFDNDAVSGPKSTRGPTMAVRLPSLDELFATIESSREDQIEKYAESLQQQKRIGEEFRRIAQELRMERELNWENAQDVKSAAEQQERLIDGLEELARQFDQANQLAVENRLMTLEMMQKIEELQKLFNEVATPEMKEALKKLQESLAAMDKSEIEQALKDFEMSLEDVMKNLERAIAQLKRMQIEQIMQDMIRQAEEILRNQQDVNSLTERSESKDLPNAAPREEQVRESLENLKSRADELRDMLPEAMLDRNPDAQKFCSAPGESGAEQDMENMAASLRQSMKDDAARSGESAEAKLSAMTDKMKESQSAMSQKISAELAEKMRRVLDDIFDLSDKQEGLVDEVQGRGTESAELRGMAEKQQQLQRHAEWLDKHLFELSKESVFMQRQIDRFMSQCMSDMAAATSSLSEMRGQSSINSQLDAVYSLNQASRMIMEALGSQKQCSSSCNKQGQSLCNKMGQMCGRQKSLNEQTEGMCSNPNGKGASGQADLRRLAGEQASIQKSLQELQQEFGDQRQIHGRLENLGEEMQKVIEALEQGGVEQETLQRQRKIYQRMLDFQLAMERQDYSEQRRAEQAEQILRRGPGELDAAAGLGSESYERSLQKFLQEGYPAEYEELIKDYFKALMEVDRK